MPKHPTLIQPLLCVCGLHTVPPPRDPPGPIVAYCACCNTPFYYYGFQAYSRNLYPTLLVSNFPRVIGPMASL